MNERNRLEILRAMGHDLQFSIQKLQMLPKNALHEASRNLLQKNKKEAKQNGMYALEISKPFHICTIS